MGHSATVKGVPDGKRQDPTIYLSLADKTGFPTLDLWIYVTEIWGKPNPGRGLLFFPHCHSLLVWFGCSHNCKLQISG